MTETVHKKGRTHSQSSDAAKADADGNLKSAAVKDMNTMADNLRMEGKSEEQIKQIRQDVHERNKKLGIYGDPPDQAALNKLLQPGYDP
jgi:hypothetical protein